MKQRLADAEASLAASQANANQLSNQLTNFNEDSAALEARIVDLTAKAQECNDELVAIQERVSKIID